MTYGKLDRGNLKVDFQDFDMIYREPCRGPRIGEFWSQALSQNRLFNVVGAAEEEFWRYRLSQLAIHPFA